MCVAIPAKIIAMEGDEAVVDVDGVRRKASLMLVEGATTGDYVILHAGFAISVMDEKEAMNTLSLFEEMVMHAEKKP